MFKGTNHLEFCEAQMIQAVQYYLTNAVFKGQAPKVTGIDFNKNSYSKDFTITMEEPTEVTGDAD